MTSTFRRGAVQKQLGWRGKLRVWNFRWFWLRQVWWNGFIGAESHKEAAYRADVKLTGRLWEEMSALAEKTGEDFSPEVIGDTFELIMGRRRMWESQKK